MRNHLVVNSQYSLFNGERSLSILQLLTNF